MKYCIVLASLFLFLPNVTLAETSYRKSLNNFWKKELKEEGLVPLTYASSIHKPKSVFVSRSGVLDFYASGLDLLPESRVKTHFAEISLPGVETSSSSKLEFALQLKKVKEIADVDFNALNESGLKWKIESSGAEMHFFAKRDARRVMDTFTKPILDDYLKTKKTGERLFQVVKAVYVKDSKIVVESDKKLEAGFKVGVVKVLEKLGFDIDKDKKTASSLGAKNMYVAIGLRELTSSGLKSTSNILEKNKKPEIEPEILKLSPLTINSEI